MTPRQKQCLDAIRDQITALGYAPSISELCAQIGGGRSAIHRLIVELERQGHLVRDRTRDRGLLLPDVATTPLSAFSTEALRAELARREPTIRGRQGTYIIDEVAHV